MATFDVVDLSEDLALSTHQEAAQAWLEEAEEMRAAQGGHVTLDQALAFSLAYSTLALTLPPIPTPTPEPVPEADEDLDGGL